MFLEDPKGSITQAGTDPEPKGEERGKRGGALGDSIRSCLNWTIETERKRRGNGMMGAAFQTPNAKAFTFSTSTVPSLADV